MPGKAKYNAFQEWATGLLDGDNWPNGPEVISQAVHEREYYVAKLYKNDPAGLKARWDKIGYKPKEQQLDLF